MVKSAIVPGWFINPLRFSNFAIFLPQTSVNHRISHGFWRKSHHFHFPMVGTRKRRGGGCPPMTLDGPGIHKPLEDDMFRWRQIPSGYVKIAIEHGHL
jgi:hypothetical protein